MHIFQTFNQVDFETKLNQFKENGWDIQLDKKSKDCVYASRSISRPNQIASVIKYGFICLFTLFLYKPATIELKYAWDQKKIVQLQFVDTDTISKIYHKIINGIASPQTDSSHPIIKTPPSDTEVSKRIQQTSTSPSLSSLIPDRQKSLQAISEEDCIKPVRKEKLQGNKGSEKEEGTCVDRTINPEEVQQKKIEKREGISEEQTSNKEEVPSKVKSEHKTIITEEGNEFAGIFNEKGRLHGPGKITLKSGLGSEEGEFEEGVLIQGKVIFSDGTIFDRQVVKGKWGVEYHGKKSKPDGTICEGDFSINLYLTGIGKKTDKDGTIYEGEFGFDDQLFGKGKITDKNGMVISGGVYKNGLLHGALGKKIDQYGNISEGMFEKDFLHGQGKRTESDGTIHEGEFQYNELCGQGKITYKKLKLVFVGQFNYGRLNGDGKIIYEDGSGKVLEGIFKDNSLVKPKVPKSPEPPKSTTPPASPEWRSRHEVGSRAWYSSVHDFDY